MCNLASRDNNDSNINLDTKTVSGFGDEWSRFTQVDLEKDARNRIFHDYFAVFPWNSIEANADCADIGCGSGRWTKVVDPWVECLHLIDASDKALSVAHRNLKDAPNVMFHHASFDMLPLEDESLDFVYSFDVLHHIPDTVGGIRAISEKLKRGAPFLIYLYYAFDNRSPAYRVLWRIIDMARRIISRLPYQARYFVSQLIAILVYFPFARLALLLEKMGVEVSALPL
ncbi:class I SAM-dependent methyltransferase, partial [Thiomicrospira sp.]|uniref:class I SAM-dependent methyltransferase n=1 Tax=Thiomicrospira sp. TaxID=935 RepID=UPI002F925A02